jgi:hypothetical protein
LEAILRPAVTLATEPNRVTLRWPGRPGRTYRLFLSASALGPWTAGPVFTGDGSELVFADTDLAGHPQKFYQVRMEE